MIKFIPFALVILCSCSSVKKSQRNYQASTDSTRVVTVDSNKTVSLDSSKLSRLNTVRVIDTSDTVLTEIIIDADTAVSGVTDWPLSETDYRPAKLLIKGIPLDLTGLKVKRITFRELMHNSSHDSLAQSSTDSLNHSRKEIAQLHKVDSAGTKEQVNEQNTAKSKRRVPALLQVAIIGGLFLFLLIFFYRKKNNSMKILSVLLAALCMVATGCVSFKDSPGKWVFGEGLWLIGVALFAAACLTTRQVLQWKWKENRWHGGWLLFTGMLLGSLVFFIINTISNR